MKVALRLLSTALVACTVISASAADKYKYLTFKETTGTETSYLLKGGLNMTFDKGYVNVKNSEGTKRINLKRLSELFFTEGPTATKDVTTEDGILFDKNGNSIIVTAPIGTQIVFCNVNGVGKYFITTAKETKIEMENLKGDYVLKASFGDKLKTLKIQK